MRLRAVEVVDDEAALGSSLHPYQFPSRDEAGKLAKTLGSARHKLLVDFIVSKREAAGLTQTQLAEKKLGEYQSFVARLESGQRRIDVIAFLALAAKLGFEPARAHRQIGQMT